jgi:lipopolysaccharide transport system permease protein
VIDGFRWALLGGTTPLHTTGLALSALLAAALLASGIRYFRATEKTFADVI